MAKCRKSRKCTALKLNVELLMTIALRMDMPLQTVFQWRCVCKAWKAILADQYSHKDLFGSLSQTPLWFTVPARRVGFDLAAYDPRIKCWQKWRSSIQSKYFSLCDIRGDAGNWLLVQKSSILCQPSQGLWLVNPTKKLLKKLPNVLQRGDRALHAMGMGMDDISNSCRVFVVTVDQADICLHKVHLFDVGLDSWKEFGSWQRNEEERFSSITFFEGTLYSLRIFPKDEMGYGIDFCFFDRHEGKARWQKFSNGVSGTYCFLHLFQWQGHLMFIGGRELKGEDQRCRSSCLKSVHIWQFNRENDMWVESMAMPDQVIDHLFVSDTDWTCFQVRCETCHDQVCVTSTILLRRPEDVIVVSRHVMCDLSTHSWWKVPEPPFQHQDISRFSVLIPNLAFDNRSFEG